MHRGLTVKAATEEGGVDIPAALLDNPGLYLVVDADGDVVAWTPSVDHAEAQAAHLNR